MQNPEDRPSLDQILHSPLMYQFRMEYLEAENLKMKEENSKVKEENNQLKTNSVQFFQKAEKLKNKISLLFIVYFFLNVL
jgi:hypothetical protein